MYLVTASEMQAMDRQTIDGYGIPGQVLMENAGRGATRVFLKAFGDLAPKKVGIVAGRGNNGGDGFVMARYLAQHGIKATVYLLASRDTVQGDAAANLDLLDALAVPIVEMPDQPALEAQRLAMRHQQAWIDAILGTGLKSEVKGYYRTVIESINQFNRPVLAVDIPSGLNADTGQPWGVCIRAHVTVTFGLAKLGHLLYPGADYTGDLQIVDIGIPNFIADAVGPRQFLLDAENVSASLPSRPADAHKGRTGHLLVVAGATGKSGAAAMTAMTAMRAGAGLVTLGVPASLNPVMETVVLEAMTTPLPEENGGCLGTSAFDRIMALLEDKKALALGPGIGTAEQTCKLVHRLLAECPLPIVLDADGLNCLAQDLTLLRPAQGTPYPDAASRRNGSPGGVIAASDPAGSGPGRPSPGDHPWCPCCPQRRPHDCGPPGRIHFHQPDGQCGDGLRRDGRCPDRPDRRFDRTGCFARPSDPCRCLSSRSGCRCPGPPNRIDRLCGFRSDGCSAGHDATSERKRRQQPGDTETPALRDGGFAIAIGRSTRMDNQPCPCNNFA